MSQTKLFFVQWCGLAFLVPLAYYWLTIAEASAAQLIWSLVVGLFAVGLLAFLIGLGLLRDWRKALARTHWLCFFVFGFLLWAAACLWVEPYLEALNRWLASSLTALVRKPIPTDFFSTFLNTEALLRISFVAALPVAAWLAVGERRRWPQRLAYWMKGIAYVVVGGGLPLWVFSWIPAVTGTTLEIASFAARTALALGIAVAAWIWFAQVVQQEVIEPSLHEGNDPT